MSELIETRGSDEAIELRKECAETLAKLNFSATEDYPENPENPWLGRRDINTPFGAHRIFVVPHKGVHHDPEYFVSEELSEEEAARTVNQLPSYLERITIMKYEGYWGFIGDAESLSGDLRIPLSSEVLYKLSENEFPIGHSGEKGHQHVRLVGDVPTVFGTKMNLIGMKLPSDKYVLRVFPPNEVVQFKLSSNLTTFIEMNRRVNGEYGELRHSTLSVDDKGFLRIQKDPKVHSNLQQAAINLNVLHKMAATDTEREYSGEVECSQRESTPYLLFSHHNAAEILANAHFE